MDKEVLVRLREVIRCLCRQAIMYKRRWRAYAEVSQDYYFWRNAYHDKLNEIRTLVYIRNGRDVYIWEGKKHG